MPTSYATTAKHALRKLLGTSSAADIDAGIGALADDLDAKIAVYETGTLASRPVLPAAGKAGRLYVTTDGGVERPAVFLDRGSDWLDLREQAVWISDGVSTATVTPGGSGVLMPFADATDRTWNTDYDAAGLKVLLPRGRYLAEVGISCTLTGVTNTDVTPQLETTGGTALAIVASPPYSGYPDPVAPFDNSQTFSIQATSGGGYRALYEFDVSTASGYARLRLIRTGTTGVLTAQLFRARFMRVA